MGNTKILTWQNFTHDCNISDV